MAMQRTRALVSLAGCAPHVRQFSTTSRPSGKSPNIAIAGVTGAVGMEFLACMHKRGFKYNNLKLLASARSAGKTIEFEGNTHIIEELTEDSFKDIDIALFSAGGSQSKKYAPAAVKAGCIVIDNSSAFRMTEGVPLVVPEVNPGAISKHQGIIANPNCSTIIMNVAVWPLYQISPVKRVVVSTYQAASGAGAAAMAELEGQARAWAAGEPMPMDIFRRQYMWNLFSHNAPITEDGYNEEEVKMIRETRKIFNDDDIQVTATCVRVPVLRAHCESINVTFQDPVSEAQAFSALRSAPGITVVDDRVNNLFPEPLAASGLEDCLVGRIRQDVSQPDGRGIDLFVAGDQLLKGAALNAVQIAELL